MMDSEMTVLSAELFRFILGFMEIVSEVFRDDLRRKRYRTDGFRFDRDKDGAIVHLIRGEQQADYYNDSPTYNDLTQWGRVIPAVREEMGDRNKQVVVIFSETYGHGPAEHVWPGAIARGAYYAAEGGTTLYSAHLLKDEFCGLTLEEQRRILFDRTPVVGRKAIGQPVNSPRGKFAEHGIGAVAHELGHAFGLPHDFRRDDQFVMGNGFRNLRRNFTNSGGRRVGFSAENASLLMANRHFNSTLDVTDNVPPEVELKLIVEQPRELYAVVSASDKSKLRTAVFSDLVAGTIVGGEKLNDAEVTVRKKIPQAKLKDGSVVIRVIVSDSGGNQTRVEKTLKVE